MVNELFFFMNIEYSSRVIDNFLAKKVALNSTQPSNIGIIINYTVRLLGIRAF